MLCASKEQGKRKREERERFPRKTPRGDDPGPLDMLPSEIWKAIFEFVGPLYCKTLAFVCKMFHVIAGRCGLWTRPNCMGHYIHTEFDLPIPWMRWAIDNGCPIGKADITAACKGRLDILTWMDERGFSLNGSPYGAAAGGHINILQWLEPRVADTISETACCGAARGGRLEVLQWLTDDRAIAMTSKVAKHAANSGQVEVLQWLKDQGCPIDSGVLDEAVRMKRVNILTWLRLNAAPSVWNIGLVENISAKYGHLPNLMNIAKYARPPSIELAKISALYGHLHILRWFKEVKGIVRETPAWNPFWSNVSASAAKGDHVHILEWALANGALANGAMDDFAVIEEAGRNWCTKTLKWLLLKMPRYRTHGAVDYVMEYAHEHSSMEAMGWLKENGYGINDWHCIMAAQKGWFDVMRWFGVIGWTPNPVYQKELLRVLVKYGRVDLLEWALEHDAKLSVEAFTKAIDCGNVEIWEWMYNKNCPWDTTVCKRAVVTGNLKALKWLMTLDRPCPCPSDALEIASRREDTHMVSWLEENNCQQK